MKLPQYTIGEDVLDIIGHICKEYGKKVLIIGGKTALEKTIATIEVSFKKQGIQVLDYIWYGGECSFKNIESLKEMAIKSKSEVIIGVGGGKAIDTAKVVGDMTELPVITVPTISSTCAATTMISVIYEDKGDFNSIYLLNNPPVHILIDTGIIATSPTKYLWAGIGDTVAKYYEVEATTRGKKISHSMEMGKQLSIMCVNPLIEYGTKAIEDSNKGITSFEFKEVILNIIITTGIVSMLVGEKYNGACAHGLFNALTSLEHIEKNHLHGEVVSYGVLVMLMLDGQEEEFNKLYPFYKKIKLPTSLLDLEVENNKEYLNPILEKAVNMEDVAKMPYKVTKDMLLQAIKKLEDFNSK